MPRGRKPEGETALSSAERQARYRASLHAPKLPAAVSRRPPPDHRSRARRWPDTVAALVVLQAEYAAWSDALPDSLRDTATAQALQEIIDRDLHAFIAIQPPQGYRRD